MNDDTQSKLDKVFFMAGYLSGALHDPACIPHLTAACVNPITHAYLSTLRVRLDELLATTAMPGSTKY